MSYTGEGFLESLANITGNKSLLPRKTTRADIQPILDRVREGMFGQESGSNFGTRDNPRTGAAGGFQVLPENVPTWTNRYVGRPMSVDEFKRDPEAQKKVFNGEFGSYLSDALDKAPDEDTAVRMAAAGWYGGKGAMHRFDDPVRFRANEPSFREYTTGVLNRSRKVAAPQGDFLTKLQGLTKGLPEPSDFLTKLREISGGTSISPTIPGIQTLPGIQPEHTDTITSQVQSAMDAKSPRAAVLTTDPAQAGLIGNMSGFQAFPTQAGTLWVNTEKAKKLKLKTPADIQMYLDNNPDAMTRLIGKVENISDTSQGPVVLTVDPKTGIEQAASRVTSSAAAQQQIAVDKRSFPGSRSKVVDAQDVVKHRQTTYVDTGTITDISNEAQPQSVTEDQSPGSVSVSLDPNDFTVDGQKVTEIPQAGRVERPRQAGKPTDDLNRVAGEYVPVQAKDAKDAITQAIIAVDPSISKQQAAEYVKSPHVSLPGGWNKGDKIQIPYSTIAAIKGTPETVADIRTEQAESRVNVPNLKPVPLPNNFGKSLGEDINKDIESATGFQAPAGAVGELAALPGDLAGAVGGIIDFANKFSPSMNAIQEIVSNGGKKNIKVQDPTVTALRDFYEGSRQIAETSGSKDEQGKDTFPTTLFKMAGSVPKIMVLSAMPGGLISGFALDNAAVTQLRGGSPKDVATAAVKGGLQGAVFKFLPRVVQKQLGEFGGNNLIRAGIEVPALGATNYLVGKAFGDPDQENLVNSMAIALLHGYGLGKEGIKSLKGKIAHGADAKGNEVYLKVEDGKLETVEPQKADFEFALPESTEHVTEMSTPKNAKDMSAAKVEASPRTQIEKSDSPTYQDRIDRLSQAEEISLSYKEKLEQHVKDGEVEQVEHLLSKVERDAGLDVPKTENITPIESGIGTKAEQLPITEQSFDAQGGNKAVNGEGEPVTVYHGTPDVRDLQKSGFRSKKEQYQIGMEQKPDDADRTFFFTDAKAVADSYADPRRAWDYQNAHPKTLEAQVNLQDPLIIDMKGGKFRKVDEAVKEAKSKGHDGLIVKNAVDPYNGPESNARTAKPMTIYAVFDPAQIRTLNIELPKIKSPESLELQRQADLEPKVKESSAETERKIKASSAEVGRQEDVEVPISGLQAGAKPPKPGSSSGENGVQVVESQSAKPIIGKGVVSEPPVQSAPAEPPKGKPSKVGVDIEARAIADELTKGFEGTAEYDPITFKEQGQKVAELLDSDLAKAKRIMNGAERLPEDMRGSALIKGLERRARASDDIELLRDLAKSPLTSETSRHAQELGLLRDNEPYSPVKLMQEVQRARGKGIKPETNEQVINSIKAEVKKTISKPKDWKSFIDGLICK